MPWFPRFLQRSTQAAPCLTPIPRLTQPHPRPPETSVCVPGPQSVGISFPGTRKPLEQPSEMPLGFTQ